MSLDDVQTDNYLSTALRKKALSLLSTHRHSGTHIIQTNAAIRHAICQDHLDQPPTCWTQSQDKMDLGCPVSLCISQAKCQQYNVPRGVAQTKYPFSIRVSGLWSPLMPCHSIKSLKGSGLLIFCLLHLRHATGSNELCIAFLASGCLWVCANAVFSSVCVFMCMCMCMNIWHIAQVSGCW